MAVYQLKNCSDDTPKNTQRIDILIISEECRPVFRDRNCRDSSCKSSYTFFLQILYSPLEGRIESLFNGQQISLQYQTYPTSW